METVKYVRYGRYVEISKYECKEGRSSSYRIRRKADAVVFVGRRADSVARTRTLFVRRVLSAIEALGSPVLCTLTFDKYVVDVEYASVALRAFNMRLRRIWNGCETIFVPELSEGWRLHYHGLLFGVPMYIGDKVQGGRVVRYGKERETRTVAKCWRRGYVDVRETDGDERLAYYLSKYVTKSGVDNFFGRTRMFRCTYGIPFEFKLTGEIAKTTALSYVEKCPRKIESFYVPYLGNYERKTYVEENIGG